MRRDVRSIFENMGGGDKNLSSMPTTSYRPVAQHMPQLPQKESGNPLGELVPGVMKGVEGLLGGGGLQDILAGQMPGDMNAPNAGPQLPTGDDGSGFGWLDSLGSLGSIFGGGGMNAPNAGPQLPSAGGDASWLSSLGSIFGSSGGGGNPYAAAGGTLGNMLGDEVGGDEGDFISGAATGASTGSMFGPWGALAGGIIGGGMSLLS